MEIKKHVISGFINFGYVDDKFETIILESEVGWKFDLLNRFRELHLNEFTQIQVNYHLSEKAIEINILRMSGAIQAEYEVDSYHYSSMTSGTDYYTHLSVGGHDLMVELRSHKGKFIIMEINCL